MPLQWEPFVVKPFVAYVVLPAADTDVFAVQTPRPRTVSYYDVFYISYKYYMFYISYYNYNYYYLILHICYYYYIVHIIFIS